MKSKTISIAIAVVALAVIIFFSNGVFEKETVPVANYPTKEFRSKYGFTVTYPENWIIDDSQEDAPAEFIREPNGRAFYSMQAQIDPRLVNSDELENVYQDTENSFRNDEKYLVEESGWEHEDKTTADNSYFAAGLYAESGQNWRFKEVTIFSKSGNVLVLRGMSLKEYAREYGPIIDKIFSSVMQTDEKISRETAPKVTQEDALAKVKSLPEVMEYEKMLVGAGKQATIEAEDQDDAWGVHVFEVVTNDADTHTATFGWYQVNKQTGVVEKEI